MGRLERRVGRNQEGGAGEDRPAPLPLLWAFTSQWAVGQRPPPRALYEGRARRQVPKKLLPGEAAFVEGVPPPTSQPLKVTRLV